MMTATTSSPSGERAFVDEVREATDAQLRTFFSARRAELRASAPEAELLATALEDLTMRGGAKRLRPAVMVAAQRAIRPDARLGDVVHACAALEVLQSYLLVHDDWMDGDLERRGGPSVHVMLRREVNQDHLGDALAILAGDLGNAWAWDLLIESASRAPSPAAVLAVFSRMQRDVVAGQALDLRASTDVTRMQQLKTGSYTVDGPLALGATLAGATAAQLDGLARFGVPIGEAFQVRDDLLGTFGDTAVTGKPVGNDLRAGKRTAIVREAETTLSEIDRAPLTHVFGRTSATEEEVRAAMQMLERTGVRARVETRLEALLDASLAALDAAPIDARGRTLLAGLARKIARREQ
jgi:geranylgeranyl diphosphate synthase type I